MITTTRTTTPAAANRDSAASTMAPRGVAAVRHVIGDPGHDRTTNLLRLQGWRGDSLEAALAAGPHAHRIAPAACGILALAVAATGSVVVGALTFATALIGVFASNHPFELAYNRWTRAGRANPIPPNRAAKRFGCAVGSLHLAAGTTALAMGASAVAWAFLGSLGVLALFVASTNVCVPSVMYTMTFGVDRSTHRHIAG